MPTVTLTYTQDEIDRTKAAQEFFGHIDMTTTEHLALFKRRMLEANRKYVRKAEYEIAVQAVSVGDIGGT